jgi:hypothetical protein
MCYLYDFHCLMQRSRLSACRINPYFVLYPFLPREPTMALHGIEVDIMFDGACYLDGEFEIARLACLHTF